MARKMKKFAEGGSDRYQSRYDRKTKDIESDYQKALKAGKNADIAKAKMEQRMADAKDDLAKWTKADRTQTRAGEKAAEMALSEARKTKGASVARRDAFSDKLAEKAGTLSGNSGRAEMVKTEAKAPSVSKQTFAEAFRAARADKGAGKTFTWQGKSYSTNMAGEGAGRAAARKPATTTGGTSGRTTGTTVNKPAQPSENVDKNPITVVGKKPKDAPKQWFEGKTAGERMGNAVSTIGGAPFRAFAKYNPVSLAASSIFDGKPSTPAAAKPASTPQSRLASMKKDAEAPGASQYAKDRYRMAKETGLTGSAKGGKVKAKKPAPVKKMAKGGSVDGCAIRGKTRAPMRRK